MRSRRFSSAFAPFQIQHLVMLHSFRNTSGGFSGIFLEFGFSPLLKTFFSTDFPESQEIQYTQISRNILRKFRDIRGTIEKKG